MLDYELLIIPAVPALIKNAAAAEEAWLLTAYLLWFPII